MTTAEQMYGETIMVGSHPYVDPVEIYREEQQAKEKALEYGIPPGIDAECFIYAYLNGKYPDPNGKDPSWTKLENKIWALHGSSIACNCDLCCLRSNELIHARPRWIRRLLGGVSDYYELVLYLRSMMADNDARQTAGEYWKEVTTAGKQVKQTNKTVMKIEKNIPIPSKWARIAPVVKTLPFDKMEVGDSIVVNKSSTGTRSFVSTYCKKKGIQYKWTIHSLGKKKSRVWRIE